MWNTAIQRAQAWPEDAPRRDRLAIALPVRAPDTLYGPLPTRHVNTSHLRRFVLMMQYRSANAAERHTGIKAACILYAIRRIEERLNTPLFTRDVAIMQPTAAAYRLYPCALRLLAMWDGLIADLDQTSGPVDPGDPARMAVRPPRPLR